MDRQQRVFKIDTILSEMLFVVYTAFVRVNLGNIVGFYLKNLPLISCVH
jgi:hypothetical protein